VKECEAITLEFILAVYHHSNITKLGENPHRLMKIASNRFPISHIVSTTCCHPHYAIQRGIDLEKAKNLDEMASMVTGLAIRSSENHYYNRHRDEYDAAAAARKLSRFGGPKETEKQRNLRDKNPSRLFGGPQRERERPDVTYMS
jgi:hypothetical protein